MNNAKVSESGAPSPKPLMGMLAGVSKGVMLGGLPLFVGAGIGQRGFKIKASETDEETGMSMSMKVATSMNYLDAWVVMPYPVGPGLAWAGPAAGMFLNGKAKIDLEILGLSVSEEEDMDEGSGSHTF